MANLTSACILLIMVEITVQIPDENAQLLENRARQLGISPEELAGNLLVGAIAGVSEEFKRLVGEELEENAELYRRLS